MLNISSSIEDTHVEHTLYSMNGVTYVDNEELILVLRANSISTLLTDLIDSNIMFELLFKNKHESDYFIIRNHTISSYGHTVIRYYLVEKNVHDIIENEKNNIH